MVRGKFLSKDGQWYDTPSEKFSADLAWNVKQGTQEKQNRLLQQQNRLMEQQMQMQYDLEQEKIQKDYEIEMKKLQHEEKMRLYKLFDDVGISKETYDTFINTNFLNKTTVNLMEQRDEHLLMSSKYDFLLHYNEKIAELGLDAVMDIMDKYDMHTLDDKISAECYDKVLSKTKQMEKNDLINRAKSAKKWLIGSGISTPLSLALFITVCEGPESIVYVMMILMICIGTTMLVSGCVWSQTENQIKEIPDNTFNINKYHNKLNMLIEQEIDSANKLTETIKTDSEKNAEALYNFRLNQYNANVEKLLIDVGFKDLVESLGLEYKRVNNSNKKKDGTIEDYIEYFETNS